MQRRAYLSVSTTALVALAGCGEVDDDGEADIILDEITAPEEVEQPNATISIEVTLTNNGDADGDWDGFISTDRLDESELELDGKALTADVPAGETTTVMAELTPSESGIAELRLRDQQQEVVVVPADLSPRITEAAIIDGWEQYGDVLDNQIDTAAQETTIAVGVRYLAWDRDGRHDMEFQITLFESDGTQLSVLDNEMDRLTDSDGWGSWERFESFDSGTQPGVYEAEVLIRDQETGETSNLESTTFTVE